MKAHQRQTEANADRRAGVAAIVEDVLRRRSAGESLPDGDVAARHADLEPELSDALAALGDVQRARRWSEEATTVASSGDKAAMADADPMPPDWIPGYRLTRVIRAGAQGAVYAAIQLSTDRKVAVKVIHHGLMPSPGERARFEREVRILAQLRHPHIVAIHDSGVSSGRAYFVMEYIAGRSLDEYMESAGAAPPERLRLFAGICDAVHAAHLRGVIHRDLKPSNIRVDDSGQPFVLDFGLAKFADGPSPAGEPAATHTGQFVGSLPWASPEQLRGRPELIDVRSDVYSLGVMLYQLVAGRFPYDVAGEMPAVMENILSREPERPSLLRRESDGELDTIVLKCLAKAPERRYQSAGDLAADIGAYLRGDPIAAKRDSGWYVLRKQLRRHRAAVAATGAFAAVVTAALIVSLLLWRQAIAQRDLAEQRRTQAETVIAFLQDMVSSADPLEQNPPDYTVRQLLDEFAAGLADRLRDQPRVEASLRSTIGWAYYNLGEYAAAEPHLRRALALRRELDGPEHPATASSLRDLGWLIHQQGDYAEARRLFDQALALQRAQSKGKPDAAVAATLGSIGSALRSQGGTDEAERYLAESLGMYRALPGDHRKHIAVALNHLGILANDRGNYSKAETLLAEALALQREVLGDNHPHTLVTMNTLGVVIFKGGDHARAEPILHDCLARRRATLGEDHPSIAASLNNLAMLHFARGEFDAVLPIAERVLAMRRKLWGSEHPEVAAALHQVGITRHKLGDLPGAEAALRESLDLRRRLLGDDHPRTADSLLALGVLLSDKGDFAAAESMLREALAIARRAGGEDHPEAARLLHGLASVLLDAGRFDEAEPAYREALDIQRVQLGEFHPATVSIANDLAALLYRRERYVEAEPLFRRVLAARRQSQSVDAASVAAAVDSLGACLLNLGRTSEAETVLLENAEKLAIDPAAAPPRVRTSVERLISLYEATEKYGEAETWRRRLEH